MTSRLNVLLQKRAGEAIDASPSADDFIDVLQGFRQRKSKDLYMRIRKQIIARKNAIFPPAKTPEEERRRAEKMVNLIYSFASNRPNQFGVYKIVASEELDEMLSHFDADIKEAIEKDLLEPEHLVRLA